MDLTRPAAPGAPDVGGAAQSSAETDDSIARQARVDRAAFGELYLRHRDAVFGYLRARTTSDDDALELTAIAFERALFGIDRYAPRGAGFRAWLFRIARNAAVDDSRRRRRFAECTVAAALECLVADDRPGPDVAAAQADDVRRVRAAIATLGNAQRDALGLRFGAGLSAREIGAVINKREAAVQKLIERAIDRLREVLG